MREDSIQYAQAARAKARRPRYVIRIVFETASPALTSHSGISGVPGDVIEGVLQEPAAISQKLIPDEGRTEIGTFSFSLIDKGAAFTEKMRAKLQDDGEGIRGRTVIFYDGYQGFDFSAFQVFQTQVVQYTSFANGAYKVQCADITREQRKDICEPKATTLRDSITETSDTVPVYTTDGFEAVAHGSSWSDASNTTCGYVKIQDEIIRWSSKTPDSYVVDGPTGRGALNTKAVAHEVDAGTAADRRTKVEEYIYLELPAVKLAWSILTGQLYGSSDTLPDHWHLGTDPAFLREADFTGIGPDLWVPSDDSAALTLRFEGLKKTDGKSFLEKEIYLVLGCYSPVYSDGTLGLRRLPALLGDAAPVVTLTEREVVSAGDLTHDDAGMHNIFRVNWNWDAVKEEFTRITYFSDDDSIGIHGEADLKEYSFKGLHGSRHTDATVRDRLHGLRDAYAYPPERIPVTVHGSLSYLEPGDVVRLKLESVRDYAGAANAIDRAFAIFQKTHNPTRNTVDLDLFGSTGRPLPTDPANPGGGGTGNSLPDAWYPSEGASLSTVATVTANVMATGNYTINGGESLTADDAIFYWDGDLTIPSGCNLTITENVQLRIKGFLTLNGTINGNGGGKPGVSDPGTGAWDAVVLGNPGFVGHSRGFDGIKITDIVPRSAHKFGRSLPASFTRAQYDAFPFLSLNVVDNALVGLPDDIRGTGGAPGGRLVNLAGDIDVAGDSGEAGGAGLAIICRGMTFGVSATITLNGEDTGTTGDPFNVNEIPCFQGAGGPGGPGALLILLDGSDISIPDVTGKVVAITGGFTQKGNPMSEREQLLYSIDVLSTNLNAPPGPPHCGYADPGLLGPWSWDSTAELVVMSPLDMSNAAHRIQYIPASQMPSSDQPDKPPPPSQLRAGPGNGGNILTWINPNLESFDVIEVWASIDNNRENAVRVGETRSDFFTHRLPLGGLYYYWIRAKKTPDPGRPSIYSEWERPDDDDGESSNIETPGEVPEAPDDFVAVGKLNGIQFNWSLPWAKLSGLIRVKEADHGDTIDDATTIWEGYDLGVFISKDDDTVRDYWIVLAKGGAESVPNPVGDGLPAAASSVTASLTATASPASVSRTATLGTNPRFVVSPPATCVAGGGTPPYTYLWTWFDGGVDIDLGTTTFNDTAFSATHGLDGTVLWGVARCTVTDDVGATAFCDVNVQLSFPSIA